MLQKLPLFVAPVFLLVTVAHVVGDEPKEQSGAPETVARIALEALKDDRLDDFCKLMHPDALKSTRAILLLIVEEAAKEGQEKQALALFSGVRSADELKKLDDVQVLAAFYRGIRRIAPALKKVLDAAEIQTIGHVMEGKDTAHVVCRMIVSIEGVTITEMSVMSLQRTESGWRMLLSGDVEGKVRVLKQKFGRKQ